MHTTVPEVTIVCSAWHKQKNLELFHSQHLSSLVAQSIPVRVIYVADGGLDLQVQSPLVDVVRVPFGISTAQAFNIGLSLTETEFFCALNLDDYFFQDALQIQVDILKAEAADATFGDWEIRHSPEADFQRRSQELNAYQPCQQWPPERATGLRLGSGDRRRGTWGPGPVFRTQAVKEAYGYARVFGNGVPIKTIIDYILWQRLLALKKRILVIPRVLGTYYSNPGDQQEFRSEGMDSALAEHRIFDEYGALA